jgi:hypothetical protein
MQHFSTTITYACPNTTTTTDTANSIRTVGGDDDALALLDLRGDALVPEGQHAVQRDLIMHEQQRVKSNADQQFSSVVASNYHHSTQLNSVQNSYNALPRAASRNLPRNILRGVRRMAEASYLEALSAHIGGLRDVPVLVVVARVHGRGRVDRGWGHVCCATAAINRGERGRVTSRSEQLYWTTVQTLPMTRHNVAQSSLHYASVKSTIRAAPDLDLVLAVLVERLLLVHALQSAVMSERRVTTAHSSSEQCEQGMRVQDQLHAPFVQLPSSLDRNVHLVGLFQREPQSSDGPLQVRSERHIELKAILVQQLAGRLSLQLALLRKRAIIPSGEKVLIVPGRFTVAKQHQLVFGFAGRHCTHGGPHRASNL